MKPLEVRKSTEETDQSCVIAWYKESRLSQNIEVIWKNVF